MKFIGGPKDGEPLFLQPGDERPTGDVTVTSSWFNDDDEKVAEERHLYRADAFGNLRHVRRLE